MMKSEECEHDIDGVDALIADFRADPRNKVFVGEEILLASVEENYFGFHASSVSAWHWPGAGRANAVVDPASSKTTTDVEMLRRVIRAYLNGGCSPEEGGLDEAGLEIYDAAVAVCYSIARSCFGADDHSLSWLVGHNDDFVAELRPW